MAQATKPKLGFKRGGHVQGPGTETSDSIPALLSDGEYVLPADTVRAIGVKKLDQLKNATHTPSGNQRAMQSVRPFAARGFASGGLVEDERKKLIAQIPDSAPDGWTGGTGVPVTGNEFTRNVVNTAQALAPVAPVASGAAKLAAAAPKVLASPIAQTAIAYGVPAVGGVALLNAASDKPANAPVSKPNVPDAQRPVSPDRLPPVEAQTNTAPDGSPLSPASDAPVQAQQPTGAVIQPPQPAAGFIPAQIRHSGNDWQARNDLRNLEVSASSITAAPNGKEMMAYRAGLEADKALKEGKNPAIESQNRDAAFMDRTQAGANAANYRADIENNIAQQRVNQEGVKLGFESDAAKQLQTLRNQIMTEKDDKKRSVLLDNYQTLTGKFPRPDAAERMTVVQLPDTIDPETKQVMRGGQAAFGPDGRRIDLGGGQQQSGVPTPKVGEVKSGYRFKGGNPADQKSWEKI